MSIAVTGATGHLGQLVVESLIDRGVPPQEIVATGRDQARLEGLRERGVVVRRAAYDDPAALKDAFADAEKLLLVSGSEVGRRVDQHRTVIEAARSAGVGLVAYTSIPRADRSPLLLAAEHRETEEILRGSGLPFVLLRNSWYLENYTAQIPTTLQTGVVLGAAGEGRVSAASRADYAEAAVSVLLGEGQAGQVYELGGDKSFTMTEYAAALSAVSGTTVEYRDLTVEEYAATLIGLGLPQPVAELYADGDAGVARGDLLVTTGDLSRLIGRPITSLEDAIRAGLA